MATAVAVNTIHIHDEIRNEDIELNIDLQTNTPQQVLEHLKREWNLMPRSPEGDPLQYELAFNEQNLPPDEPLGRNSVVNVPDGATLSLRRNYTKGGFGWARL